jgi:FKBP-type peptidyl-prolyl cis-trans isomerase (trigger factor)
MKAQYSVTINKKEGSEVEITGAISWEQFSQFEEKALGRLLEHVEIDGFRKGHVPPEMAKKHIGDELLLSDMAELALQSCYADILKEHDIDAIGRPHISLTKIARGNELGFTITTSVMPEVKLPDYKTIGVTIPVPETQAVTEEDVEKVIHNLRELRAYGHVHEEGHDHQHDDKDLPEVNDEFAKSFGDFENVDAFKTKIRENITKEKEQERNDKRRLSLLEALIEKMEVALPEVLITSEIEKMRGQFEADIERAGMKFTQYLEQLGKKEEELIAEFRPQAEKRAKTQLLLYKIAEKEGIKASDEEVAKETEKLLQMYPGADKMRTEAYADMVIVNEKVFAFLGV